LSPRDATRAALARTRDAATRSSQPFHTAMSTSGEKGRITVDLGPDLYRNFNTATAWHDRKMNDVVRELVTAWLKDHPLDTDSL
jgi:hypothetical protein